MRILSDSGIRTYAFIGPIYPTSNLDELRELVRRVHEAGACYVLVDRLNLKRGVWLSLMKALGPDPVLLATARRRLFLDESRDLFYPRAFRAVEDEATSLGLAVSRA
jgi:DNA repair photolyase